jgi:hypothetical protein
MLEALRRLGQQLLLDEHHLKEHYNLINSVDAEEEGGESVGRRIPPCADSPGSWGAV